MDDNMSDSPQFLWLNGEFANIKSASLSIFDRGFLFGDGVFSTLKFENGALLSPSTHIKNLLKQCENIGIMPNTSPKKNNVCVSVDDILSLIKKNQHFLSTIKAYRIKVIISGGNEESLDLSIRSSGTTCILIQSLKHPSLPINPCDIKTNLVEELSQSDDVLKALNNISKFPSMNTADSQLKTYCTYSLIPYNEIAVNVSQSPYSPVAPIVAQIKSLSYLQRLALKQSLQNDVSTAYVDVISIDVHSNLLEGIFSNIFWVFSCNRVDSEVSTSSFILQCPSRTLPLYFGSTLTDICSIASKEMRMIVEEVELNYVDIPENACVFLCNSIREVVPVTQLGCRFFKRNFLLENLIWLHYQKFVEKIHVL